ncbi:unnamed protein product [Cyclocybe aegerita]|uniref:Proteasome maturation factor UMP1 n=1 Tax=Cyclocybe aegerita TaxID=1973307 RepID=A0A8S0VX16_CYCAE|nr:unnamed protein product [Cyclocybe aegerita]
MDVDLTLDLAGEIEMPPVVLDDDLDTSETPTRRGSPICLAGPGEGGWRLLPGDTKGMDIRDSMLRADDEAEALLDSQLVLHHRVISMEPSLRIVPATGSKSASIKDTTNSLGLHDTLQYGPRSLAAETKSQSGLKERLENWEATQDNLKLTLERNLYGMHAPLRRLMERKIVSNTPHTLAGPHNNLHLDILMGRDETIDPSDVFMGLETGPSFDIHKEIQKKVRT